MKYDLANLFEKTPLFDIPPINYDEDLEHAPPWTKLTHFILNGERGSMMNYVKTYQERKDNIDPVPKLPFFYRKVTKNSSFAEFGDSNSRARLSR